MNEFECIRVTTQPFAFGNPTALPKKVALGPPGSRTNYDLGRDGRVVGFVTAGRREAVRGSTNQIQVVVNWFEELKARVPPP